MLQGQGTCSAVLTQLRHALAIDARFAGETLNYRRDGSPYRVAWVITPVPNAAGRITHWISIQRDVTELRETQADLQTVVHELNHRVKNLLATVQAIMNATMRSAASITTFRDVFTKRLASLASIHTLLSGGSANAEGVQLRELLADQFQPYETTEGRIRMTGPDVKLPQAIATPLSMAIHELTTNALKYGALSNAVGTIDVEWTTDESGVLPCTWTERDGPAVSEPTRIGFGSKLLRRVLIDQLGAEITQTYAPEACGWPS